MVGEARQMVRCAQFLVLVLACELAVSAEQLSAPTRRVPLSDAGVPGAIPLKWGGGYLISWRSTTSHSDAAQNLAIYDRDGRTVRTTRLWFPDAALLYIRDAAAQDDKVVAVGNAMTGIGGPGEMSGFLAFVPIHGGAARIVQTSPFEGVAVAVGPDRSVWVLGFQVGEERRVRKAPDHAMLHHYDQDGKLIGKGLPWSSFRCGLHPVAVSTVGRVGLAASKDRIGVLLPDCHEWVEFNLGGELTGRWSWRDVPITNGLKSSAMSSAVAMTPSNEVFARIGIGLYRLNREQGAWDPVDLSAATDAGAMFSWLAGNDGESLIYTTGRELIWANATKQ